MKKNKSVDFGVIYLSERYGRVKTITKAMYGDTPIVVFSFINDGGTVSEPYAMSYIEFMEKFC